MSPFHLLLFLNDGNLFLILLQNAHILLRVLTIIYTCVLLLFCSKKFCGFCRSICYRKSFPLILLSRLTEIGSVESFSGNEEKTSNRKTFLPESKSNIQY